MKYHLYLFIVCNTLLLPCLLHIILFSLTKFGCMLNHIKIIQSSVFLYFFFGRTRLSSPAQSNFFPKKPQFIYCDALSLYVHILLLECCTKMQPNFLIKILSCVCVRWPGAHLFATARFHRVCFLLFRPL
jgi:hypothetical protein